MAYNGIGLGREVHGLTFRGGSGSDYTNAVNSAVAALADEATGRAAKEDVIQLLDEIAEKLDNLQQFSGDQLRNEWQDFMMWLTSKGKRP